MFSFFFAFSKMDENLALGSTDICPPMRCFGAVSEHPSLLSDLSTFNLGQHHHCSGPFFSPALSQNSHLCIARVKFFLLHTTASWMEHFCILSTLPALPTTIETWISNGRQNFHTPFVIIQLQFSLPENQFSSTITIRQPLFLSKLLPPSYWKRGSCLSKMGCSEYLSHLRERHEKDALGDGHCTAEI